MKLQQRALIILAITTAILVVVFYLVVSKLITDNYSQLETSHVQENAQLTRDLLQSEVDNLETTGRDYAYNNAMYVYSEQGASDIINNILSNEALAKDNIDFLAVIRKNGTVLFKSAVNPENSEPLPFPQGLLDYMGTKNTLKLSSDYPMDVSGLLILPEGTVLISSHPILSSRNTGPSNGSVIIGRFIDAELIHKLSSVTRLDVSFAAFNDPNLPEDYHRASRGFGVSRSLVVEPVNETKIAGYVLLRDIDRQPVLILKAETERDIYAQGQASLRYLLFAVLFAALGYATTVWLLLGRIVLGPVSNLDANITAISRRGDPSERLPVSGNDELASLAVSINKMLTSIEIQQAELNRRLGQIRTAAEISRSLSSLLDPSVLLPSVVDLIRERFDLYYVGLFLIDEKGERAVLRAGTGEAGQAMMASGHSLTVGGNSMIGWATRHKEARIALDVGEEAVRFNNPHLPLTRSELAMPIIGRDKVLGAMTIQSDRPNAFDENDILIIRGIADSLSIALENAELFTQTQRSLQEISKLNRVYLQQTWSKALEEHGDLSFEYLNPGYSASSPSKTITLPLTLREQAFGEMNLDLAADDLTPEEKEMVEAIIVQTSYALENARLFEQTVRRANRERRVLEITSKFRATNDPQEMLRIALEELQQTLNASRAQVILQPEQTLPPDARPAHGKDNNNGHNDPSVLRAE